MVWNENKDKNEDEILYLHLSPKNMNSPRQPRTSCYINQYQQNQYVHNECLISTFSLIETK